MNGKQNDYHPLKVRGYPYMGSIYKIRPHFFAVNIVSCFKHMGLITKLVWVICGGGGGGGGRVVWERGMAGSICGDEVTFCVQFRF